MPPAKRPRTSLEKSPSTAGRQKRASKRIAARTAASTDLNPATSTVSGHQKPTLTGARKKHVQKVSSKRTGSTKSKESEASQSRPSSKPLDLKITPSVGEKPILCHLYDAPSTSKSHCPTLIFTHGAGGTISAPAVVSFCTNYAQNHPVIAFQGSMNLKARTKAFGACIRFMQNEKDEESRILLGGRSMGARAAVMAANNLQSPESILPQTMAPDIWLILISYPLQGPKDVRDQILFDLDPSVRVLFISGEKDAMCPLELLATTRKKVRAKSQLIVVRGADHGMIIRPKSKGEEVEKRIGTLAARWVDGEMTEDESWIGGDEPDD